MKTETSHKIIEYIQRRGQATAHELTQYLSISRQALFKHLNKLQGQNQLTKIGKPPKVFYMYQTPPKQANKYSLNKNIQKIINEHYLIITPKGEIKNGLDGFIYWCQKNNLDLNKTSVDYVKILKKYDAFRKDHLINGLSKMRNTFKKVFLDQLYYLDFYSMERFGKTKLGQLLLYAKQSQNKLLIKSLIKSIKPMITRLIARYHIDGIGFIPPTVKREVQFMRELQRGLSLPCRHLTITKIKTNVVIPQKTLNKLIDRIENAKTSLVVEDSIAYNNILLIDDAVGSGATMNETARQIKSKGLCRHKIIGLAITGSFKGFDVISEI